MPKIIGVHGIANTYEGRFTLKAEWFPALRSGLDKVNVSIEEKDFDCVVYGDLFRDHEGKSPDFGRFELEDLTQELSAGSWEAQLLGYWWKAAAEIEPESVPPLRCGETEDKFIRTPRFFQDAARAVLNSAFFRGLCGALGRRALVGSLRQVNLYMHDPKIKRRAQQALADVIDNDSRVLIGHSLGSIIAYEYLASEAGRKAPITTLVTLGSPLGTPQLIFDQLTPAPLHGKGQWPNNTVERWFNIADECDPIALQKKLSKKFHGPVVDLEVHNGFKCHRVGPYLTARRTGESIAKGL